MHTDVFTMLPDFKTEIMSINDIFKAHRIFFSFFIWTFILGVINPSLLSQVPKTSFV